MTNQDEVSTHQYDGAADIAEAVNMVTALYNNYTNLPNVQQKLIHHIMDALPTILENTVQQCKQREERKKSLEEKSDEFIEEFLAKTRYFYNSGTELFFIYSDDKTYEVIKEDNIQHSILTTITASHKDLLPWKYKIKIQIIKRIRENNNILKSIPESETIQNIVNDPSTIINTLNDENVKDFWNKSVSPGVNLFKTDFKAIEDENANNNPNNNPLFYELKKYIMLKNLVSYFIWYLLTGILITSISYNYMLTVPCVQTPKQARIAAAQFLADKNKAQQSAEAAKSSAPVYQTDGK